MSYVRLKHTLSKIALDTLTGHRRAETANALAAYCRAAGGGPAGQRPSDAVGLGDLAAAAAQTPDAVRGHLLETGLFVDAPGGRPACPPSCGSSRRRPDPAVALADPFRPHAAYLCRQVGRLEIALRLLESPPAEGVPASVHRGAALMNAGLFFECHEYLEDVWRAAREPERTFYHGLVQAAAACYHWEKGNAHGADVLARKAIARLEPYAPAYLGLDVAALVAALGRLSAGAKEGAVRERSGGVRRNPQPPGETPVRFVVSGSS